MSYLRAILRYMMPQRYIYFIEKCFGDSKKLQKAGMKCVGECKEGSHRGPQVSEVLKLTARTLCSLSLQKITLPHIEKE